MRRLIVESLETRLLLAGPDTTPPLLGIKEPAADVPVEVGSELQIVVEAADPESGISQVAFAYRLGEQPTVELGTDKEPEDGFTVILSTKSMPLGSISLIATATNGAGLISVAETKTTLVDLTAPTVILKSPTLDNALSIGDTVRFQAEAADGQSGLKSIQFLADTDPEVEGPEVVAAFDVTGPSGEAQFDLSTAKFGFGLLTIGVAASDQAGLAASEALKIFLHDPTAPIASFIAPTDGTPYSPGRLLLITVQATDPESGIQSVLLRADLDSDSSNGYEFETEAVAGGNSEYSGIFSARDLADGQSVLIEAVVTNGDGDSLVISHSMTADGTPPAVLVRLIQDTGTSAEDLITRNGLIQIDAGDGSADIKLDGFEVAPDTGGIISATGDGPHTIQVTSTDTAGNSATTTLTFIVDTSPPEFSSLPADQAMEATGPFGVPFDFDLLPASSEATDAVDPTPIVSCSPTIGSNLPFGITTVRCIATDDAGNDSLAEFAIVVEDTAAPLLIIPPALTMEATSPTGAVVSYSATANDIVDGVVAVNCSPRSGNTFPIGTTTVDCSASDSRGNIARGSFAISVQDNVPPNAPPTPDLEAASDSGGSRTDNITNVVTPTFRGTAEAGSRVELFDGALLVATDIATSTGTWSMMTSALGDGSHVVTVRAIDEAGNTGNSSEGLHVTIDTTPPMIAGLKRIPATGKKITSVELAFSEAVDCLAAGQRTNYVIALARKGRNTAIDVRRSICGAQVVTLVPEKPLFAAKLSQYSLIVRGGGGISDLAGNMLEGDQNGGLGGNYITSFAASLATGRSPSIASSTGLVPTVSTIDSLLTARPMLFRNASLQEFSSAKRP